MTTQNLKIFERVRKLVYEIPEGRVATYGQIAEILNGNSRVTSRVVGWALHQNKDPDCPCHRVVNREGRLAPNFAFDGWREQKRRLLAEKIGFKDENHVNLRNHLWRR